MQCKYHVNSCEYNLTAIWIIVSAWQIKALPLGSFLDFFFFSFLYFLSGVGWILACRTCRYRGLTVESFTGSTKTCDQMTTWSPMICDQMTTKTTASIYWGFTVICCVLSIAVDPWITWVWTMRIHLYMDFFFFNQYIQWFSRICGWLVESKDVKPWL